MNPFDNKSEVSDGGGGGAAAVPPAVFNPPARRLSTDDLLLFGPNSAAAIVLAENADPSSISLEPTTSQPIDTATNNSNLSNNESSVRRPSSSAGSDDNNLMIPNSKGNNNRAMSRTSSNHPSVATTQASDSSRTPLTKKKSRKGSRLGRITSPTTATHGDDEDGEVEEAIAVDDPMEVGVDSKRPSWQFWRRNRKVSETDDLPSHADIDRDYPDDPSPPLSNEELKAFYTFSWSVEPMVIVIFTALAPLILQSLAAGNGYEAADHTKKCDYSVEGYQCVVAIGSSWVDVSSFAFYTSSISVGIQAFVFISLGAIADYGVWRKRFMLGFLLVSASCMFAFLTIRTTTMFLFAALLLICGSVSFGTAYVFYNAYIPLLAKAHPMYLKTEGQTEDKRFHVFDALTNTLSTTTSVYGYIAAVLCFACAGAVVITFQTVFKNTGFGIIGFFDNAGVDTYAEICGCAVAAAWCLIGLYQPYKYMRVRPGPKFPKGSNMFFFSWIKVWHTVRKAKRLPNTFLLLLAWFLLSDAITTLASVTILFAQNELGFKATELIVLAIGAPIMCAAGNYLWLQFQRRYQWPTKSMVLLLLCMNLVVPIYGMLGFIPFMPVGLKHKWELFPVGIYYGSLLGAIQSFYRVLFAELLPAGQEAEYFSLYAITDKGSSWFGPLIVGAITGATHRIAYAWFFLIFMLGLPIILVWFVNVEKGKRDVAAVSSLEKAIDAGLEATSVHDTGLSGVTAPEPAVTVSN